MKRIVVFALCFACFIVLLQSRIDRPDNYKIICIVRDSDGRVEPDYQNLNASEDIPFTDDEILLIAKVTLGEAEGESEAGKRLVVDTILNRLRSPSFPDDIYGVIYQPNAFECLDNGRIERCVVTPDIIALVRDEVALHSNKDVVYFQAETYSAYGEPLFCVGNHYFSME